MLKRVADRQDKCNEAITEMNLCLQVGGLSSLHLTRQEIIQSSSSVQMAAQLNEHYSAGVANYMRNLDIMPEPK